MAVAVTSDHPFGHPWRGDVLRALRIPRANGSRARLHRSPECGNVLLELANDEIAAVLPQVTETRRDFRRLQPGGSCDGIVGDHRARRLLMVTVDVSEHELAQWHALNEILFRRLVANQHNFPLIVGEGLGEPVGEAEMLAAETSVFDIQ